MPMPTPGGGGAAAAARHPPSGEAAAAAARDEEQQEEEGEEDLRDGGVPFFVNRGGLPVDEPTWERMWRHVGRIHPEGERVAQRIRGAADLPKVRHPHPPTAPRGCCGAGSRRERPGRAGPGRAVPGGARGGKRGNGGIPLGGVPRLPPPVEAGLPGLGAIPREKGPWGSPCRKQSHALTRSAGGCLRGSALLCPAAPAAPSSSEALLENKTSDG